MAGGGGSATLGDGVKAISATLNTPMGLAVDASENIYIAEYLGNRIRLVTKSTGIISTVAGNGKSDHSGDGGQATVASLKFPSDVAVDTSGNIYIAESASNCIRMVTKSTGIITTVAGMYSIFSPLGYYSGDGGQATSAALNIPGGVAVDASGNIYIADTSNYRIRLVTKSTGIISTVAGTATSTGGQVGDGGLATSAALNLPAGIVVDASGNVYIADTYGYRIRLVTKSTGILSTVAGTGSSGGNYDTYGGDGGKATLARLSSPSKLALDASGNIYVSDSVDRRIRMFKLLTETNVASTSSSPSPSPTTSSSTVAPSSLSPSRSPTTSSSTAAPSSVFLNPSPTTSSSTVAPSSLSPSPSATTSSSTAPSSPSVPTAPSSPVIPGASSKTSASQGKRIKLNFEISCST